MNSPEKPVPPAARREPQAACRGLGAGRKDRGHARHRWGWQKGSRHRAVAARSRPCSCWKEGGVCWDKAGNAPGCSAGAVSAGSFACGRWKPGR